MLIVGITGSFGTGKTTVAKFFKQFGAKLIDADKIAHQLLKTNSTIYKNIIQNFGKRILKDGSLNIERRKLAKVVFKHRTLLNKLNKIIHPAVIREIKKEIRRIKSYFPHKIIAIEAPLLIEAGLLNLVDKLVVVTAHKNIQISRIKKIKNLSKGEIELIIKAQLPLKEKLKSADYVVDNNGSLEYTKKQVREIWELCKNF
ncbi:MAG: dephospho-CoA kinase [Candidatus Omnitrophota bacterium]|nr:dephospho-CoA kinase [Candidatus Omnitrophota bacterium]